MTNFLLPQKEINPLLASTSFVGRSLSSLAALRAQIFQLRNSIPKSGNETKFEEIEFSDSDSKSSNQLVRLRQRGKKE